MVVIALESAQIQATRAVRKKYLLVRDMDAAYSPLYQPFRLTGNWHCFHKSTLFRPDFNYRFPFYLFKFIRYLHNWNRCTIFV